MSCGFSLRLLFGPAALAKGSPFTDHGEFNYNGRLKEDFFFDNLFSKKGKCEEYTSEIISSLEKGEYKTILLTGNQGCGKTTFIHYLNNLSSKCNFVYFDFDKNTSHPTLEEYIELLSNYLLSLINGEKADDVNKAFYNLYISNKRLIKDKANAENKIGQFFDKFYSTFVLIPSNMTSRDDFVVEINDLFFNQILSLVVLWHLAEQIVFKESIKKIVFCLDNLDVLVNQEIIERFFKEYFLFVRNIDGIINHIKDEYIQDKELCYNDKYAFVLNCRQHTWARVKKYYQHDNPAIHVSFFERDITDAFDKRTILSKREEYINKNKDEFGDFVHDIENTCSLLNDLDATDVNPHTLYGLFNDDYRQCILTVEDILKDDKELLDNYMNARKYLHKNSQGLRGIFYRALFEWFKNKQVFREIGVLDLKSNYPLVSNARLLLNYLNYSSAATNGIPFKRIVDDFDGIIGKDDIDNALTAMFMQGYKAVWNELIAFNEIDREIVDTCEGTDIIITSAGREYIDFVATHFEFFNTRVTKQRQSNGAALFSESSREIYSDKERVFRINGHEYHFEYLFEETIFYVMEIVKSCCDNMTAFYDQFMKDKYEDKEDYLHSPFVYGESGVLHGERIIHTHIRYIDNYRLHLLGKKSPFDLKTKIKINEKLVRFISEYIIIGKTHPAVITKTSEEKLFPAFEKRIKKITDSGYTDFKR